jgi:hypothetical protein
VIDFLVWLHASKQVWLYMIVCPAKIEVKIRKRLRKQKPFILKSDVLDNSILGVYMSDKLPLTLTAILFFLLAN